MAILNPTKKRAELAARLRAKKRRDAEAAKRAQSRAAAMERKNRADERQGRAPRDANVDERISRYVGAAGTPRERQGRIMGLAHSVAEAQRERHRQTEEQRRISHTLRLLGGRDEGRTVGFRAPPVRRDEGLTVGYRDTAAAGRARDLVRQYQSIHDAGDASRDRFDKAADVIGKPVLASGVGLSAFEKSEPGVILGNLARDSVQAATGIVDLPVAIAEDLQGYATGDRDLSRTRGLARDTVEGFKYQYGPLAEGDVGEFYNRFREHPLGPTIDALTLASLGAGGSARAGLLRRPSVTRRLGYDGGDVQLTRSPNTLTGYGQSALDALSARYPDLPVLGSRARVAKHIPFQREKAYGRIRNEAVPLAQVGRRLSKDEDYAYSVLADYGADAPGRARQEIEMRRARAEEAGLFERRRQVGHIKRLERALPAIDEPTPKLWEALDLGAALSARSQRTKIEAGQLTEEGAEQAVGRHTRALTSEDVERPIMYEEAEARLADLEKRKRELLNLVAKNVNLHEINAPGRKERREADEAMRRAAYVLDRVAQVDPDNPLLEQLTKFGADPREWAELQDESVRLQAKITAANEERAFGREGAFQAAVRAEDADEIEGAPLITDAGHASRIPPQELSTPRLERMQADLEMLKASGASRSTIKNLENTIDRGVSILREDALARRALRGELPDEGFGTVTSRTIGDEPGEGAFYTPDVTRPRLRGARRTGSLARPPQVVHESKLIAFEQGRFRRGHRTTVEDFLRSARLESHITDVQDARRFARPLNEESPSGLDDPGRMVYFNPEGAKIPRALGDVQGDAIMELSPKRFAQALRDDADALARNAFPDNVPPEKLHAGGIMQIDRRIADAYKEGKVRYRGRGSHLVNSLGDILDASNNVTRLGLLYLKGSYVPLNFASNLGYLGIDAGVWAPTSLMRAAGALGDLSPTTLRMLDEEVGEGGAIGVGGGGRGPLGPTTQAVANFSSGLADRLPRRANMVYHIRRAGIKGDKETQRLLRGEGTFNVRGQKIPAHELLNQLGDSAEQGMVKFRGLTDQERDVVARAIFIYPWMKGSTRYGFRLAIDKPTRAAIVAHVGREGWEEMREKLGRLAHYFNQLVPVGEPFERAGRRTIKASNPQSVTPLGTSVEAGEAAVGFARRAAGGPEVPRDIQPSSFLSPPVAGLVSMLGQGETAKQAFGSQFTTFPALHFAQEMLNPSQVQPLSTPPDRRKQFMPAGRKGELIRFFFGTAYPRDLDVGAARERGRTEKLAEMPLLQREQYKANEKLKLWTEEARRLGIYQKGEPLDAEHRDGFKSYRARYEAYARAAERLDKPVAGRGGLSALERTQIDLDLAVKKNLLSKAEAREEYDYARSIASSSSKLSDYRSRLHDELFGEGALSYLLTLIRQAGGRTS